ncbi:hypothetical protein MRX96_048413 [Rhipicephalus microplus]
MKVAAVNNISHEVTASTGLLTVDLADRTSLHTLSERRRREGRTSRRTDQTRLQFYESCQAAPPEMEPQLWATKKECAREKRAVYGRGAYSEEQCSAESQSSADLLSSVAYRAHRHTKRKPVALRRARRSEEARKLPFAHNLTREEQGPAYLFLPFAMINDVRAIAGKKNKGSVQPATLFYFENVSIPAYGLLRKSCLPPPVKVDERHFRCLERKYHQDKVEGLIYADDGCGMVHRLGLHRLRLASSDWLYTIVAAAASPEEQT